MVLDGLYGMSKDYASIFWALPSVDSSDKAFMVTSQIATFEHVGNWSKALECYDLQVRSVPTLQTSGSTTYSSKENSQQVEHTYFYKTKHGIMQENPCKGIIRSLQKIGCSHLVDVYCQGLTSQRGQFQHDLEFIELQLLGVWETGISARFILVLIHQFHIIAEMGSILMKTCTRNFT